MGAPIQFQSPGWEVAAAPRTLALPLAGSSTGPSTEAPVKGEPLRLWLPLSVPESTLQIQCLHF